MFKKDDTIEIPAGTIVFRGGLFPEVTKRASKATVDKVLAADEIDRIMGNTFGPYLWEAFLTDEEYQKFIDAANAQNTSPSDHKYSLKDKLSRYNGICHYPRLPIVAELRETVEKRLGKFDIVWWSKKIFTISTRLKLASTSKKESVAKKPSKRALMIKGSKWIATQDFDVVVSISTTLPSMSIKKGTIFTILGKGEKGISYVTGGWEEYINIPVSLPVSDTILHPMPAGQPYYGKKYTNKPLVIKDTIFVLVPFASFGQYVEQVGEAKEQYEYVIRDSATGTYYRAANEKYRKDVIDPTYKEWYDKFLSQRDCYILDVYSAKNPPPPFRRWYETVDGELPFEMEKLSRAKKYTDLGKVKIAILNLTNYYSGLDDFDSDSSVEWIGDNSETEELGYPFPETFEAVKIGKFSKEEIEVIDLQQWYKTSLRLRVLTKKYGSTVRKLFQTLEEKGATDGEHYVVNFRVTDERANNFEHVSLEKEDIKKIEDQIKNMNISHTKAKGAYCFSVLVNSLTDALAVRMVDTAISSSIIDVQTMQELVNYEQD